MFRARDLAVVSAAAFLSLPSSAQGPVTRRVTVDSNGVQANSHSEFAALARSGTHVAFLSAASNLVPGDTNSQFDVFVHDLNTGLTTRESVDSNGVQCHALAQSTLLGISPDGRFVVFGSRSPNLVPGDVNGQDDVFLRDRQLGTTTLASVGNAGQQGALESNQPSVSDDGRYVVFESRSANLVTPDTNGANRDVFVRDMVAGTTFLADFNAVGMQPDFGAYQAVISGDGRYVAFRCDSPNMVPPGAFPGQIFVRDIQLGTTSIESVSSAGQLGDNPSLYPSLSTDGRFMAFTSYATNLGGLVNTGYVRDRLTGTTTSATLGYNGALPNNPCIPASVSDDGRFLLFQGNATNILPWYGFPSPGFQSWLRDLQVGDSVAIGVDHVLEQPLGAQAFGLSSDGRVALFRTAATNVVPGDTNLANDFFVRIEPFQAPIHYCTPKVNSLGCEPLILAYGRSSATQTAGFEIRATFVRNQRPGLLLYSLAGRAAVPFAGGTLCLAPPLHRNTPGQTAGGSALPTNDCTGNFAVDMNAFAAGLLGGPPPPALTVPGTNVQCQWWSRDPGFPVPDAIGLTGAVEYTVGS